MSRVPRSAALLLVGALTLAACGSDDVPRTAPAPSVAREAPTGEQALNPGGVQSDVGAADPVGTGADGGTSADPVEQDAAAPDPTLGAQMFAMWSDFDVHEQVMDQVVAAGSSWIRFDIGWCTLEETGRGQIQPWYQQRLDTVVAAAEARGLQMMITLTCSPAWARADGRIRALPEDPSEYQRVAEYVASRYRGRVAAWELWNEPDCLDLVCGQGSARQYVRVLKAGYRGIKAGDPAATVVSGGISGINLPWIETMLERGAGEFMDALALNSYQNPSSDPPDTPATRGFQDKYRLTNAPAAHDVLVRMGYPDLPIWIAEIGWSTGRVPERPRYDGVPPETQAAYLTQSLNQINEAYPYITHVFWFTMRDREDSTPNENGFGMLNRDLTPKPAYAAFAAANAALD